MVAAFSFESSTGDGDDVVVVIVDVGAAIGSEESLVGEGVSVS